MRGGGMGEGEGEGVEWMEEGKEKREKEEKW